MSHGHIAFEEQAAHESCRSKLCRRSHTLGQDMKQFSSGAQLCWSMVFAAAMMSAANVKSRKEHAVPRLEDNCKASGVQPDICCTVNGEGGHYPRRLQGASAR